MKRLTRPATRSCSGAAVTRLWTQVRGRPMHARVALEHAPRDAPTIVLVHGQVVSSRYMVPLVQQLAPHARVLAPDLPGYGLSEGPPHTQTVPELAETLADWMEALHLDRAHFIGNSFGCQILGEFGVRHPERVDRLVLQGPTINPHERSIPRQLALWLLDGLREPPSPLPLILLRDYADAGPRRSLHTFLHTMEDRIEDKLPHMPMPTLVVHGSRDPLVPQDWAEEAAALLPRGRLVTVPGVAHTMNYHWPLELARVALPFLLEGDADARPRDGSTRDASQAREASGA